MYRLFQHALAPKFHVHFFLCRKINCSLTLIKVSPGKMAVEILKQIFGKKHQRIMISIWNIISSSTCYEKYTKWYCLFAKFITRVVKITAS